MSWLTTTAAPAKRLKKRSVANSDSPKPPDELTFFLDRQLGRYKMAGALRNAGLNVEIHDDHFPQNAQDPQDRKSTRLNSSHRTISYAVFCLKKKKIKT